MHKVEIRPELLERLTQERGGRLHLFDDIDPARTAHVVIDLQNSFMEPVMSTDEVVSAVYGRASRPVAASPARR